LFCKDKLFIKLELIERLVADSLTQKSNLSATVDELLTQPRLSKAADRSSPPVVKNAKTAEPITMTFDVLTHVGRSRYLLDGVKVERIHSPSSGVTRW